MALFSPKKKMEPHTMKLGRKKKKKQPTHHLTVLCVCAVPIKCDDELRS